MPDLSLNLLRTVSGVGAATIKAFVAAGYSSLNDLDGITADQLTAIPGIGPATAQAILDFLSGNAASADPVQTYRHDATRKNIPPAGLAGQGKVAEAPTTRYFYDPHLPPVLRFDETGQTDKLARPAAKGGAGKTDRRRPLQPILTSASAKGTVPAVLAQILNRNGLRSGRANVPEYTETAFFFTSGIQTDRG